MQIVTRIFVFFAGLAIAFQVSASTVPFDQGAFDKAIAAGEPVVVQFHADWCPTCKTQQPLVSKIMSDPKMKDVKLFVADYDKEANLKKALRVSAQSTFVVFKSGKEVTRATGQTTQSAIEGTFAKAL